MGGDNRIEHRRELRSPRATSTRNRRWRAVHHPPAAAESGRPSQVTVNDGKPEMYVALAYLIWW